MAWKAKHFRRLIVHSLSWLGFVFLMSSKAVDLTWGFFARSEGSIFLPVLYGTVFGAIIFYGNYYYLIPKYFSQRKKWKYWFFAVGSLLVVCAIESLVDILVLIQKHGLQEKNSDGSEDFGAFATLVFANTLTANLACLIFSFAYRFPKDWIRNEKQKNQLEKDKLRSELDFLKAQINPHFLFNGINSIYHLIGSNNELAKHTLLQFSGLLRYQLYECNVDFISLQKELEYLKNYVNIEEIRKGEDAVFSIDFPDMSDNQFKGLKIAPLLISPFLENAFKYLSHNSERERNYVNIALGVTGNVLHIFIENSTDPKLKKKPESEGGIGLVNVKRRLALMYPNDKHQLTISSEDRKFQVELILSLHEN
ncbi:sensor histidine kinase [Allomuricauda sp. SCSIO 65647]|uniref:sensor histidine kinase n=1 Tax=Allomuricauda sp. SCSIO 65647 TaxID=2908843 RepID=UPI001F3CC30E|nr:histidine kinase [Muricauda sp. SCSIO 65647]UJH69190.1 histidine kinase [Muricauda sp. SCSIO 65647]